MILLPGPGTMPCSIWVIWNLQSLQKSIPKNAERNQAAIYLGYLLPNLHTQLTTSHLAKTDMSNHLQYASSLRKFHEKNACSSTLLFSQEKCRVCQLGTGNYRSIQLCCLHRNYPIFLPYLISSLYSSFFHKINTGNYVKIINLHKNITTSQLFTPLILKLKKEKSLPFSDKTERVKVQRSIFSWDLLKRRPGMLSSMIFL
ncbi:DUF3526 domain-containing protein [Chryseobacterium arthrosphaerae]|uniref:DUF3526 domain-containing protein n=1 Tax=Chryseobacterium arthrosphaerae TaxID=651561 RepID=A0A3S0PRS7_9FLAO|nr:DUF3526 domain-containing protein [Chryseobacterium arthrosphaerae]